LTAILAVNRSHRRIRGKFDNASITIRQLPETTKRRLRMRAAQHGHSMEQEARDILQAELAKTAQTPKNIIKAIRGIFEPLGGVELEIPPREPIRDPGVR